MADAQTAEPIPQKPLRLWPGVAAVVLQWLGRFVIPLFVPAALMVGVLGGMVFGLVVILWWAFFSRAPRNERWTAVLLMIATLIATPLILHPSVATGMMGMMFYLYAIPVLSLAFVAWAVVSRRLAPGPRRVAMAAAILLSCAGWALVRTGGMTGDADSDFAWRWAQTPEERLLAEAGAEPAAPEAPARPAVETAVEPAVTPAGTETAASPDGPSVPAAVEVPEGQLAAQTGTRPAVLPASAPAPAATETGAGWPGFRGAGRDGAVRGVRIATDWSASPPVEMWRRPIGPGWSSFAVRGNLIYTQEQRGDDEVVTCYDVTTGKPVWTHHDAARFWESNAGAGPRGTPTLSEGRVYTFGATGILNALDAGSGSVLWTRNAATENGITTPDWGFSSSPLVVGDAVVVAVAGALVAYDRTTGKPRWSVPNGGTSYSSPQLVTIGGVEQILLLNGAGATSVAPADGALLWKHAWPGYPIVQPALTAEGDVLLSVSDRGGTRRIAVAHGPAGWTTEERWTSISLKPYFNDFVVHEGHAFGFDGSMLACIDVKDGKRKWKGGHYGHGQLVLLPEQDLLLVLSEKGELALVKAASGEFTELGRVPAIEGKTWNHPVLAGDVLLVRNDQEMAAFRLSLAGV
jgi:outer membrane protein assembly factor BamB